MKRSLAIFAISCLWSILALAGTPVHGTAPPAGLGGAIDLVDQQGHPFTLKNVAGRPALLFFGFTRCGSTCPVALATARQLLAQFNASVPPAVLFVTLDPLNDRPSDLAAHLGRVDKRLIGLTGSPSDVERVAERYGVTARFQPDGVDHSSKWYLLDGDGRVRRIYAYDTPVRELLEDLRQLPKADL